LLIFLHSEDGQAQIKKIVGDSVHLTGAKSHRLEIPLPPLSEQKRIVEKIEKIFAKIDEAERLRAESLTASAALLPSALHQVFSRVKKEKWPTKKLREIAILNPKKQEVNSLSDDLLVSFVPMSAVDEITQTIKEYEFRRLGSVKKGYTYFKEGDILFAKITPCMENGKVAIAKNLKNGIGFGSTEFHVLRPRDKVLAEWIFYIVGSHAFREEAERHMTGTAGQQRVPIGFLEDAKISLPPLSEQKKIVAYLDAFSQKARELQELQQQTAADFSALRQSILAQAFNQG
jgi:type I restriction enzyme S subunit